MSNKKMYRYLIQDYAKPGEHLVISNRKVSEPCALHWHNYLELELIIGGTGSQTLNGCQLPLSRGCLYMLRLNDFHQVEPSENLNLINMVIDDRMLSDALLQQIASRPMIFCQVNEDETLILEQLFALCLKETTAASPDQQYLNHLLTCVLLRVLRQVPKSTTASASEERPIQSALLYLHMHFRENPTLKDCAKIAHYNASYFSTVFHKELGMTYSEYLNLLKITYAKELLLSTELKIADICYECGFASHSNFLKLFHQYEGMSPRQYRQITLADT